MIKLLKGKVSDSLLSFWSLFGRKVISRSGDYAGRVLGLYLEGRTFQGFMLLYGRRVVRLHHAYVQNLDELLPGAALLLNMDPFYTIPGRRIYDREGRKLGRVLRVIQRQEENDFEAFIVKPGLFSRPIRIEKKEIQVIKKSIILNSTLPQIKQIQ